MKRSTIVVFAVGLAACGGASKLSEAPRASSLKACLATRDAATSAAAVAYATTGTYPTTFNAMTGGTSPMLIAPTGVAVSGDALKGKGWTLTMRGGGSTSPAFTCASAAPG